jgi:hypothetical protein
MFSMVAWASLAVAFACEVVIAVDEIRYPQKMWIRGRRSTAGH